MNRQIIDTLKNIEAMLRKLLAKEAKTRPETMRPKMTNEYLRPIEIAEAIGVSPITVRRWMHEGDLPYTRFGKAMRVKRTDFEAYCKENDIR